MANAAEGRWTSTIDSVELFVETEIALFDNQRIGTGVQGAMKPYTGRQWNLAYLVR